MLVRREVILAKIESVYNTDAVPIASGTSGTQLVDIGSDKTLVSASGLTNDATAYTETINVDGTPVAVSIVGSASQTIGDVIDEINTDLDGDAVASLSGGDILITSATTGSGSTISIDDYGDLFSTLTGFIAIDTAADGVESNAILVEEPNFTFEGARMIERNPVNTSLAPYQGVYGGSLKSVTFNVEVKGPGVAFTSAVLPELDPLLRACALAVTVDTTLGSETVTYEPASSGHESITIYYYQDGTRHILTRCRGNVSVTCEAGNRIMLAFTFTGHFSATTDTALPTVSYDSTVPPVFVSAGFSVASYSAVINALNFDLGNQVITPPDANASDGFSAIQITTRNIAGSFDPEHVLVATHDFMGRYTAGTTGVIETGAIGSAQYNRVAFSFPKTYYKEISPGDRDGLRTLEVGFGAVETTVDDELSITFS